MQSSQARHRQVFRNSASAAAVVPIGAVVALVVFAAVRVSVPGVVALVAIAAMTLRAALAAVIATDQGMVVRNPLRTHRFNWRDIECFEVGDSARYPGTPLARQTNGRAVAMWAVRDIGNVLGRKPANARRVVDELNARLRTYRQTT